MQKQKDNLSNFYVFSPEMNLLGIIDTYRRAEFTLKEYDVSELILEMVPTEQNKPLLQDGNIIVEVPATFNFLEGINSEELEGYEIRFYSYKDDKEETVEIYAYSLNIWMYDKVIPKQQRYTGNAGLVVSNFVRYNLVEPTDVRRKVEQLDISNVLPNLPNIESTQTGGAVGKQVFEICEAYNFTVKILMNYKTKRFIFKVFAGTNRTLGSGNNPVVFSKDYDNIGKQEYVKSSVEYANVAIVAGQGEGVDRTIVTTDSTATGRRRREIYVDARDLQSKYQDENGNEVIIPEPQYIEQLKARGIEYLSDYGIIETYNSTAYNVQYIYGVDYSIGDKVTVINNTIGKRLDTYITSVTRTLENKTESIVINFGNTISNIINL